MLFPSVKKYFLFKRSSISAFPNLIPAYVARIMGKRYTKIAAFLVDPCASPKKTWGMNAKYPYIAAPNKKNPITASEIGTNEKKLFNGKKKPMPNAMKSAIKLTKNNPIVFTSIVSSTNFEYIRLIFKLVF